MAKKESMQNLKEQVLQISNYKTIAELSNVSISTVRATLNDNNPRHSRIVVHVIKIILDFHENLKKGILNDGLNFKISFIEDESKRLTMRIVK